MKDGQRWDVVMTSVLGHVMGMDFGKEYSNWSSCNTEDLFHVPIENNINPVLFMQSIAHAKFTYVGNERCGRKPKGSG